MRERKKIEELEKIKKKSRTGEKNREKNYKN